MLRTALITGATRGIGREVARQLKAAGLTVFVVFPLLAGIGFDDTAADPVPRQTTVHIVGEDFWINNQPTYAGRKGENWDEGYQSPPVKFKALWLTMNG